MKSKFKITAFLCGIINVFIISTFVQKLNKLKLNSNHNQQSEKDKYTDL